MWLNTHQFLGLSQSKESMQTIDFDVSPPAATEVTTPGELNLSMFRDKESSASSQLCQPKRSNIERLSTSEGMPSISDFFDFDTFHDQADLEPLPIEMLR
jgi:hypothetical protein